MRHSQGQSEDFQNEIKFEEAREIRAEMPEKREKVQFTQEFWDKIDGLTEKLKTLDPLHGHVEVIEKKIIEPKERHQRWKNFNRHPDNFRKLGE